MTCITHKRMLRVTSDDFGVVGGRLRELAQDDKREIWYEEKRGMMVFRGTSLDDIQTFADKCHKILNEHEVEKLGPEGMREKTFLNDLAQEKIDEAIKMCYTDKVEAKQRWKSSIQYCSMNVSGDELPIIQSNLTYLKKIYPCGLKFERIPKTYDSCILRIGGLFPHAENFARHAAQLLVDWRAEKQTEDVDDMADKLQRTNL